MFKFSHVNFLIKTFQSKFKLKTSTISISTVLVIFIYFIVTVAAGVWSVGGDLTVAWKEDVRLPCENVGAPEPKLVWTHQGVEITEATSER